MNKNCVSGWMGMFKWMLECTYDGCFSVCSEFFRLIVDLFVFRTIRMSVSQNLENRNEKKEEKNNSINKRSVRKRERDWMIERYVERNEKSFVSKRNEAGPAYLIVNKI